MTLESSRAVAQVVLDHPECARVFRNHRIDFCCRGGMSLTEACKERGLNTVAVVKELNQAIAERGQVGESVDTRGLTTPKLLEHIVARYHATLRKSLPFVEQLGTKVARVHGEHNPKLRELAKVITDLRESLEPHLDEEERSLFPFLGTPSAPASDDAHKRVETMQAEHHEVGELLERMRSLSDAFTVPDWGCNSYRALMRELEALEADTLEHVHVENHVLAPRFPGHGAKPQATHA